MSRKGKPARPTPSKTRIVGYEFEGDLQGFDAVERVLQHAARKGVVTQFEIGRCRTWFDGPPGQPLREVREHIRRIIERENNGS